MIGHLIRRGFSKLPSLSGYSMYVTPILQGRLQKVSANSDWAPSAENMSTYDSNCNGTDEHQRLKKRLVWVDLEMTGLDPNTCQILEMACLITDENLNIVATGPNIVVNQSDEVLKNMNDWCKTHHGESGLTEAVRVSKTNLQQAEIEMLSFVRQHTPPGQCPLAGNTVHMDKVFMKKYMPDFLDHLHYRIVDVSTLKELCRRWYPEEYSNAPRKKPHTEQWMT
ncbi:putative oligoribonuclease, mitochondrial [Apostichopus japonicus]|uniref:Putative oligoribonuclease, mitochondrial n=1 Tax=Stichopus japonicus TaxID=307972 RepID=A0A2G8L379_STIJA|nr:putative oligoribonuclease, mitochondrial [Apostichopus japonicus]